MNTPYLSSRFVPLLLALAASVPASADAGLPPAVTPQGWGVNIHFTEPVPGEMERFGEAGFGFARMDFLWSRIETTQGTYDFSHYDNLVKTLASVGTRPLFILDYGNDLYQKGAPINPEARAAFARFTAAAAQHFAGKGVVWEIWNEPNLSQFWQPKPDGGDYAALAVGAVKAIHAADPNAVVVGPGSSGFPWEYLEKAFRGGLLDVLDGVSVHPYRGQNPETVAADFAHLRALITRYAPAAKRQMPMISSEWGYSTSIGGVSEETQAAYLGRMWLANMASGVDLSIFYDWHEDGADPKNNEHRFGITRHGPAFVPKPAFTAAKELIGALRGYTYRHHLAGKDAAEWRLLFQRGDTDDLAVVTWSADPKAPIAAQTPAIQKISPPDAEFAELRSLARIHIPVGPLAEGGDVPAVFPTTYDSPGSQGDFSVELGPPFRNTARFQGDRVSLAASHPMPLLLSTERTDGVTEVPIRLTAEGRPLPALAPLLLRRTDPLVLTAAPTGDTLQVTIENPGDIPFSGTLTLLPAVGKAPPPVSLALAAGQLQGQISLPSPGSVVHRLRLQDKAGHIVAQTPQYRYLPFTGFPAAPGSDSGFGRVLFVENIPQKPAALAVVPAPPGGPGGTALRFDYKFDPGWRYAQAQPKAAIPIPDGAKRLLLWVYSDGAGDYLRLRFHDSVGQTFQPDLAKMEWKGWRLFSVPLDGSERTAHWGGPADGVPHGALTLEGLGLIDSANRTTLHKGEVLIAAPSYVVEENR